MAGESSMTPFYNDAPNPMFGPANPEALRQLYDKQQEQQKNLTNTQAVSNALMAQQQALPQPTMPGAPQLGNSRVKRPNMNSGFAAMGDALGSLGRQAGQGIQQGQLNEQQAADREALRLQMEAMSLGQPTPEVAATMGGPVGYADNEG